MGQLDQRVGSAYISASGYGGSPDNATDTVFYTALAESTGLDGGSDTILAFEYFADLIDLSRSDADTRTAPNDTFAFVAPDGLVPGRAGVVTTRDLPDDRIEVPVFVNADAVADMRIVVQTIAFSDTNFIL